MYRMEEFATVVATQRKKLKMTQEELASHLGMTPQAISKWETGIGYPDVTLIPKLAEVLRLPIESLFGRTSAPKIPQGYEGLPLVSQIGKKVCYSDKSVGEIGEREITFLDGSVADMREGIVYNRGKGEIRILEVSEVADEDEILEVGLDTEFCEQLSGYESLDLSLTQNCTLSILPTQEQQEPCVIARGNAVFIAALECAMDGKTLSIRFKKTNRNTGGNNSVRVYTPFEKGDSIKCSIGGGGNAEIGVDFWSGELSVAGCGSIKASALEKLHASISGSGSIYAGDIAGEAQLKVSGSGEIGVGDVAGKLQIGIAGSGDINIGYAGATEARVSGSGDICLKGVRESLTANIAGSGDITCEKACEIERLSLVISGSGDLYAGSMTVGDAEIRAVGSADITLARIKRTSVEKLSKDCTLNVAERG